MQAVGGWRPWSGQPEEPNVSAAHSRFAVPQFWVCRSRLLPWLGSRRGPALALLWQIQNEDPQHKCKKQMWKQGHLVPGVKGHYGALTCARVGDFYITAHSWEVKLWLKVTSFNWCCRLPGAAFCFFPAVVIVFAAGPHYGDGTGGGERSKGQGHRRVCSCPSLLQGTRAEGTPQITSFTTAVHWILSHILG